MKTRIVILNYNGRTLLERCLPSVVKAANRSRHDSMVTVLDNQSTDESEQWIRDHFREVTFTKSLSNDVYCPTMLT